MVESAKEFPQNLWFALARKWSDKNVEYLNTQMGLESRLGCRFRLIVDRLKANENKGELKK